jgi:hypothetical protein
VEEQARTRRRWGKGGDKRKTASPLQPHARCKCMQASLTTLAHAHNHLSNLLNSAKRSCISNGIDGEDCVDFDCGRALGKRNNTVWIRTGIDGHVGLGALGVNLSTSGSAQSHEKPGKKCYCRGKCVGGKQRAQAGQTQSQVNSPKLSIFTQTRTRTSSGARRPGAG